MGTEITTIRFHGANLLVQTGDSPENTLVAMKPVVEGIGVSWQGQHEKLMKHPVLSQGIKEILIPSAGGTQAMTAIPLNRLPFWLATLQPNKVPDPSVREKVIIYQTEAADALFERFFGAAIHNRISKGEIGRQMAAIMDAKLDAHLRRMLPGMVEERLAADPRVAALDYVSVRELLEEHGALQKGRGRLNRRIGRQLKGRALLNYPPVALRKCPHSGVWLYPRSFASAFMTEIGRGMVAAHNDAVRGQGRLHLVRSAA